jgi:hypothetical protein
MFWRHEPGVVHSIVHVKPSGHVMFAAHVDAESSQLMSQVLPLGSHVVHCGGHVSPASRLRGASTKVRGASVGVLEPLPPGTTQNPDSQTRPVSQSLVDMHAKPSLRLLIEQPSASAKQTSATCLIADLRW